MKKKDSIKHILFNYLVTLFALIVVALFNVQSIASKNINANVAQESPKIPTSQITQRKQSRHLPKNCTQQIQFKYPDISLFTLNLFINEKIDTEINKFKQRTSKFHTMNSDVIYDTNCRISLNNNRVVSVIIDFDIISSEATNHHQFIRTFNFDLQNNRELFVNNYLRPSFTYVLSDYVRNHVLEHVEFQDDKDELQFLNRTSPFINNFSNLVFAEHGVVIYYNSYELSKHIDQQFEINVPYPDLQDYMIDVIVEAYPLTNQSRFVPVLVNRIIDPTLPMVALTFDDGPVRYTTQILDTLYAYNSAATFFVVGSRVNSYPDVMRRIVETGSEVANHTWSHPFLTRLSSTQIFNEIESTNRVIHAQLGVTPTLIRPPYGAMDDHVISSYPTLQYIMWSLDTSDWLHRSASQTIARIKYNISDGDIVLIHDLVPSTAEAMSVIIPYLVAKGYQLVTVSELLEARGITSQVVYSGNK